MREDCSGPYLKMLIKLWPGYWINQLKRMNRKVDEENGKQRVKGNVRYRKVRRFSSCEFWKNIGCLVSAPTFGLGVSRLWEKEEEQNIGGKKRKQRLIREKVDLYEVCFLFYLLSVVVVVSGIQAVCHVRIMRRWSSNLEQWTIQRPRLWLSSPYSLSPTRQSKPAFQ